MGNPVEVKYVVPDAANTASQIHGLKRSAFAAVLRAFSAEPDLLSEAKEECLNELSNELKTLETEHGEYLVKARSNEQFKPLSAGLSKGNTSNTEVIKDTPDLACVLPDAGHTIFQIHCLERSAYASVLRAFCAVTDHLSWSQVKLLVKLRKQLRILHIEHKEVLEKVISDEHIRSLRKFILENCSVVKKMYPAFDVHGVVHDKIASTGQLSTSSTSCHSLVHQSPISERSMYSRDIGILGSSDRVKGGSCFEPHAVVSATRLKSVTGHALACKECSPSAELPVLVSAKSCTDDTLDSEKLSEEVSPFFEEKHSQSNAGHVSSCVGRDRQASGKRKAKVPGMRGSKNQRRRNNEKDCDIIKICLTDSLLNKVEKLFKENSNPANLETAKSILKVQEKDLLDALAKLSEVSYDVADFSANSQLSNLNNHDEARARSRCHQIH
ncbi:hypothetical protein ACP4OV_027790 [Aristida adscensionis]